VSLVAIATSGAWGVLTYGLELCMAVSVIVDILGNFWHEENAKKKEKLSQFNGEGGHACTGNSGTVNRRSYGEIYAAVTWAVGAPRKHSAAPRFTI
jgi:hypothetical protein